jgi:hypothetical protein
MIRALATWSSVADDDSQRMIEPAKGTARAEAPRATGCPAWHTLLPRGPKRDLFSCYKSFRNQTMIQVALESVTMVCNMTGAGHLVSSKDDCPFYDERACR